ncbi:MAG TPA: Ppx/GppA phosphatase family protein [Tepidisphaeraceae bacterium]|nr:Ppx/GppA phosphatase family protein [Tepidisphaeraceae bacterium]
MPIHKTTRPAQRRAVAAAPAHPVEFRIAAIDVGSNSLHMIIAQVDPDGAITTLWRMKEMVGLGRISFPARRLSGEAMERAIATLRRFHEAAHRRQCEKILTVATSAVREAQNGGDFLERVRRELGMNIRVVSAREEARLIYLGVRHGTPLKSAPTFMIDIGGGSVEFIVADKTKPMMLESRKIGAARMTARYVKSDPIAGPDLKSLLGNYDRELTPLCEQILALKPIEALATSGTCENLAAMCTALYGSPEGVIEREPLNKLVSKLLESRSKDRAEYKGLDDQRKDQIIAGALLVNELFRRLNLERMTVCKSALREGILVDYLSRHLPEVSIRREVPDPRRRSVLDLARRCDYHQTHAEQVARLCMQLFDQLKPMHELNKNGRELIEYAALLHDIGWHISRDQHHKHGMYLILHGNLKGFSPEEVQIMANIVRYHRKKGPTLEHEAFASLSGKAKKIVRAGAALLRISDGLDRSHSTVVSSIRCTLHRRRVDVTIKARGDAELEMWGGQRKMDLFAQTFGRSLSFREVE